MSEDANLSGLEDDTKPNPGRIYDFFLGGNHNFEVDRETAGKLLQVYPVLPKMLKMLRWFLGGAVRRLLEEEFTQFIDFASGLPVQDHIHQIAPPGTKVVYSDKDEVTVAYAQKIIGDNPNVKYFRCDAQKPETILNSDTVKEMFDRNQKIAVGLSGISYFLSDRELTQTLDTLYSWAEPGDKLFLSEHDVTKDPENPKPEPAEMLFEKMGSPFHNRSKEHFLSLVPKWKIIPPGCQLFDEWLNLGTLLNKEDYRQLNGPFYGVFFEK